ncbi:Hypothetical predicted protein [Scomber scombrus]|uniref:Uncharacterized protein n=1 Tax=Scomber scombrus TaxID=13677 RepID=A0AAV1N5C3_SCOSC
MKKFENYCMYLPNTGHCMLRKNTVYGTLAVHSMYIDHPPLSFSSITELLGLTLSISTNLSELTRQGERLLERLPADKATVTEAQPNKPVIKHPKRLIDCCAHAEEEVGGQISCFPGGMCFDTRRRGSDL